MKILITNDDGYKAKGIKVLAQIMKEFGEVTVIAPKHHQSGMSMAVSIGLKQITYKDLGEQDGVKWSYLDATPASCVKFGLNTCFLDNFPDVVVSGINHGSNASTASCYSGTLGAAQEGALNGIPAIGVSLDSMSQDPDFSSIVKYFPAIYKLIMENLPSKRGITYNVNFPDLPADKIKGIRIGRMGMGRWIREFLPWSPEAFAYYGGTPEMFDQKSEPSKEEGEELYTMVGTFLNDPKNSPDADHLLIEEGYISIVAHGLDNTDYDEYNRLQSLPFNQDFI